MIIFSTLIYHCIFYNFNQQDTLMIEDNIDAATKAYEELKENFTTHQTFDLDFRISALKNLEKGFQQMRPEIDQALKQDLGLNTFLCEFSQHGRIPQEIHVAIKNLKSWAQPVSVPRILVNTFAPSLIKCEPMGVALVIGAWNYPFSVTIEPAIAAIAAGNCVMLKPSELAPHSSNTMKKLFDKYMDSRFYRVVEGKVQVSITLSKTPFDVICFTGSTSTGRLVAIEAAKNLTRAILQLGGKCPVIVDSTAKIDVAVNRILFGKFLNAGQTCVGVDHVYVQESIYEKFKTELLKRANEMYGGDQNLIQQGNVAKIINQFHFQRLQALLNDKHGGQVVFGGNVNKEKNFIYPTIVLEPKKDCLLMKDQIFGPIMPVFRYNNLKQVLKEINSRPKPLALYCFTQNSKISQEVEDHTTSGAYCLNDTVIQMVNTNLPFGGVGASGSGRYHGKSGFINFSNEKSVCRAKADSSYPNNQRFMPFTQSKKNTMRKLMKFSNVELGSLVKGGLIVLVVILLIVGAIVGLSVGLK